MLILFVCQIKPPQIISDFLGSMSKTCMPLSMLIIGCMLKQAGLKNLAKEKSYRILSALRLIIIYVNEMMPPRVRSFLMITQERSEKSPAPKNDPRYLIVHEKRRPCCEGRLIPVGMFYFSLSIVKSVPPPNGDSIENPDDPSSPQISWPPKALSTEW